MATNEHNPDLSNLLTAMSGSTINIVSEIDAAILDIQNHIDSTKIDIDSSITTAQNNIYSHISGSTISIDNFIDAAITNINANVDSKTSSITTIENSILGTGDTIIGVPNLNVGSKFTERRCTTSGTEETLFYFASPGYLWIQAYNDSNTQIAEVCVYRTSISSPDNLISKTYIAPQSSEIVACFPALCDDECYITGKSDGSSSLCVIAQLYSTVPGTSVNLLISDNSWLTEGAPNTIYHSGTTLNISTISAIKKRGIIKFDLSDLPAAASIDNVYLNFMPSYVNTGDDFHIGVVSEDVVLAECTYNDRSTGVAWSVPGDGAGSLSPTPIFSGNLAGTVGTMVSVDVTNIVKSWVNGSSTNNGFIFYIYPATGKEATIYTYFDSNAARRPRLTATIL